MTHFRRNYLEVPQFCSASIPAAVLLRRLHVAVRRPLQIAIELARGEADVGVTGLDCTFEFPGAVLLLDLEQPVTSHVLAIRNEAKFAHVVDFRGFLQTICAKGATVFAEYPRFVRQHIANHPDYCAKYKEPPCLDLGWLIDRSASPIVVRLSFGSTEGNRYFVDTVETGVTLKKNGARPIHTVLKRSTPWLAASSQALSDHRKRAKIMDFQSRLKVALAKHFENGTLRDNSK